MSFLHRALKRIEPRVQVLPIEVKGMLFITEGAVERQAPMLVWDLSITGLGIIVSDRLIPGETIKLTIGNPFALTLACNVVWCELQEADYDFQEPSYRAGLITIDPGSPLQPVIEALEKAIKRS